jgi:hypothetical protein
MLSDCHYGHAILTSICFVPIMHYSESRLDIFYFLTTHNFLLPVYTSFYFLFTCTYFLYGLFPVPTMYVAVFLGIQWERSAGCG